METSLESSLRGGVIAPRSRPGSPDGARPDARRLPATGHGWRRRTAQQPARGQLLQPRLPVLGVAPEPLEDAGQLTGDHGFAFAEQPPGVLHQKHRESKGDIAIARSCIGGVGRFAFTLDSPAIRRE